MKAVVIGAGLLGVTTSYFLAKNGWQVQVIERESSAGLGTSFANGGMLTPSQAGPWNEPGILLRLLKYVGNEDSPLLIRPMGLPRMLGWGFQFVRNSSAERYYRNLILNATIANYSLAVQRTLRTQIPIRYDSSTVGTMKIFRDQHDFDVAARATESLRTQAIKCHLLDPNGAVDLEPVLAPIRKELIGAIYYPDDESGDAFKFCAGLADKAAEAGVAFKCATTAHTFHGRDGEIISLGTSAGEVRGDAYVLAAGSYSVPLAKTLRLRLPITPVKGYSLSVATAGWAETPTIPLVDEALHAAVTPLGDRLRVAGTAEFSGYDSRIRPSRMSNLYNLVAKILPNCRDSLANSAAKEWAGLRPMSCDGVPLLGQTSIRNLFLNTGHGHLGWSMACGSGKAVADLITGRNPELDLNSYSVNRFL